MAEPTPEEQRRIEEMRAKLGPLPEGVEIDFQIIDPDEMVKEIADREAATFCGADSFTWFDSARGRVPAIEISGLEWLEVLIERGTVTCEQYGIGNEIEHVPVPLFAHFRLSATPLYIWIDKASEVWVEAAMDKGFAVLWPQRAGGQRVHIISGKMHRFDAPTYVDWEKVGRNEPCPCGSGVKFKRCHGA